MPVAGVIISAAASAYSANRQGAAARDAASASSDAAQQGREDIRHYYDQYAGNAQPYMDAGRNALGLQNRYLAGDYGNALSSPDVMGRFTMGLQAQDRSAASRGGLNSGGHSADLMDYGGMMASQGLNDYWNKLMGMSSQGANMTSNLGSAGLSAASGMAHQGNLAGAARGQGLYGQADASNQGLAGIGGAVNNFYQQQSARNGGGTGWYFGSQPGRG